MSKPELDEVKDTLIRLDGDELIRAWRKIIPVMRKKPAFKQWYDNELSSELKLKLYKALKSNVDLAVYGKEKS